MYKVQFRLNISTRIDLKTIRMKEWNVHFSLISFIRGLAHSFILFKASCLRDANGLIEQNIGSQWMNRNGVYRTKNNDSHLEINVQSFPEGYYFIRLNDESIGNFVKVN